MNAELRIENGKKRPFRLLDSRFSILNFILIVFLGLCLLNNVALPIFEAPDEASHFIFTDFLANQRRLPDLNHELPSHESAQPPLYHLFVAALISPLDRSDLPERARMNPDWFDKSLNADFTRVRGQHFHTEAERFPYQRTALAVHIARFFSSLLGAAVIVLVYAMAQMVFVETRSSPPFQPPVWNSAQDIAPLLAAALVAFNPKFIHVSSAVSNDIAITLTATLACWWMIRIEKSELRMENEDRNSRFSILNSQFFILGGMIGAAVLCKVGGLGLIAPALLLVALMPRVSLTRRIAWTVALVIGLLIVAGGWFLFNMTTYGDPLAWRQVENANAPMLRNPPLTIAESLAAVPRLVASYWGSLAVELHYPTWVDAIFAIALVLAVIGCVVAVFRRPRIFDGKAMLLLIVWEAALLLLFAPWLQTYVGTENSRLVMAGIAPLAILVALGWLTLTPQRWQTLVATATSLALFALAFVTPFAVISPAYATPDTLDEQVMLSSLKLDPSVNRPTFGGEVKLLHAELEGRQVKPGESAGVRVYWGATQPIDQSYRVILEALDLNNEVIGRDQFIPYDGRFSTERWLPGRFFRDDYRLKIDANAQTGPAKIQLGLYRLYPTPRLLTIDGTDADKFIVGRIKVNTDPVSNRASEPALRPYTTSFGQMIRLDLVNFGSDSVEFDWTALKQPEKDYTLFVHVLDANGEKIGQKDAQPFDGQYPTSLWDANERVRDLREIPLPAEAKQLRIGWYDSSGQRLIAQKADGSRWQDDIALIDIQR